MPSIVFCAKRLATSSSGLPFLTIEFVILAWFWLSTLIAFMMTAS